MSTTVPPGPGPELVAAARDGDQRALDAVIAASMPLVYNLVGRAAYGLDHADVDDVVQETLLRVVRGIGELERAEEYRTWLVAIALRQVREEERRRSADEARTVRYAREPGYADLGSDFAGLTVLRLGLTDQRRDVAEATRWLDPAEFEVLALWWLEEIGQLERRELASALGLSGSHAAVRVHRMKRQLETARCVVQALRDAGRCVRLRSTSRDWDGTPSPLWRKRFDRHVRNCVVCAPQDRALVPLSRLVRGIALLPVPETLREEWTGWNTVIGPSANAKTLINGHVISASGPRHAEGSGHGRPGPGPGSGPGRRALSAASPLAIGGATVAAIVIGAYVLTPGSHPTVTALTETTPSAVAAPVFSSPGRISLSARPSASLSRSASRTPSRAVSASTAVSASPGTGMGTGTGTNTSAAGSVSAVGPATAASSSVVRTSSRKGVGAWTFSGQDQALAESGASWFYTWSTSDEGISAPNAGFVPMIWGPGSITSSALAQAKQDTSCGCVLGFNEPDNSGQSNMTPAQALSLWPQLMDTGLELGSPAVASGGATPGGWLDQFMTGAKNNGYRVNFITLHWYGSDFNTTDAVSQLQSYIQAVHTRYDLPIWLTEFALISFANGGQQFPSETEQAAFLTAATAMLDNLPYVQRYAWFGLPATSGLPSTGLFQPGPVITPVGTAFEAAQ